MKIRRFRECSGLLGLVAASLLLGCGVVANAQELEPRRWSHLPKNTNFAAVGYAFTKADIFFDPVLETEDVELDQHTVVVKYIRTFEFLDHSARVDFTVPYKDAHWEGLLQGKPTTLTRSGLADPVVRFVMYLIGAPPLEGKEFAKYRVAHQVETIVGTSVAVHLPLGQYYEDKLLNLGENRFTIRPTLGVVHNHGKWSGEITGSAWFFTENDDFWKGNNREQNPLYTLKGHLIYTHRPGLWVSGSAGYGYGGESSVNGVEKGDKKGNLVWAFSLGYPLNRSVGFKLAYISTRTQESTGFDSDTVAAAFTVLW